jgi:hypothetical protein
MRRWGSDDRSLGGRKIKKLATPSSKVQSLCRNLKVPVPDDESVIHALFDLVESNAGTISVQQLLEGAKKHLQTRSRSSS